MLTRTQGSRSSLKDKVKDKDKDKDYLGSRTEIKTFNLAGSFHATNTHNFRDRCASTLFSPCVAKA